ncbi:MAG TPA: PqqD family protein [Polyangia bacterium]|nr:PqqD family protein [Polyangia bacterium]
MSADDRAVLASEFVVAQPTADGAVLMDMSTGDCFELNRSGARIWSLLTAGKSVPDIAAALAADHDAPAAPIEADVRALVAELGRRGLVKLPSR